MSSTKASREPLTVNGRHVFFALFAAALIFLFRASVARLISLTMAYDGDNSHSSYTLLIPFISLVLIYLNQKKIFSNTRSSETAAVTALAAGGILYYIGWAAGPRLSENAYVEFTTAALIAFVFAGFLLVYGSDAFKAALFPLMVLLLTIPIPTGIIHNSVLLLQRWSADLTSILFTMTRTPFYRSGQFIFAFPNLTIEVAEECSGIRSTIGMLIVSLLAGNMLLRSNWRRTALLAAVIPVSIFKNAIRIVVLTLLALHVDMGFITGRLHHEGGFAFMAGGLVLLYPILAALVKTEGKNLVSGV